MPNGLEKYMAFMIIKNLIFIGNMKFINSSLEKLVKSLSDNDFKNLIQEFCLKKLELLKQKDAYHYEYMNSFKKFCEEKLPDKRCFYDSLKDQHISDKYYLTCNKIWNKFNMKNMGDYHHYSKKRYFVISLCFWKFTGTCLKFYKLDPCHYFSSPGLSWDAMLKMTGLKVEQSLYIEMYLFFEKGLRGGVSYICKRFSKASNKYMKNYDPRKLSKYIMYFDANN